MSAALYTFDLSKLLPCFTIYDLLSTWVCACKHSHGDCNHAITLGFLMLLFAYGQFTFNYRHFYYYWHCNSQVNIVQRDL
jgi:hypothetical protein